MPPTTIDETTRVSVTLKLLWAILGGVAGGAFLAAGVYFQGAATAQYVKSIDSRIKVIADRLEEHERRLIRLEAKAGIVGAGKQTAEGWGER
jgi:hypothetical protein